MQFDERDDNETRPKGNPFVALLRATWQFAHERRKWLVASWVLSLISNIIWLAEPVVVGKALNIIQFSLGQPGALTRVVLYVSSLIGITVFVWIFHGTSRVMEMKNAFWIQQNCKRTLYERSLRRPLAWHQDRHSGELIDRVDKASRNLFDFSSELFMPIASVVGLVGSSIVLVFYDWQACVIALVVAVIAVGILLLFDRVLIPGYQKVFKLENRLAATIQDYLTNVFTVITLRLESRTLRDVRARMHDIYPPFARNSVVNEWKWFSASFCISVMKVVVLILNISASYRADGAVVIGTLFVLYSYLDRVGHTFYNFAWQYGEIVRRHSAYAAANDILNDPTLPAPSGRGLPSGWRTIEVTNLTFRYPKRGERHLRGNHLENVSLTMRRGERIALIGESGSGKSTILAVLRGLYEPQAITVTVDGKPLPAPLSKIAAAVTLIPQSPEIFHDTVRNNITMGANVSDRQLRAVMQQARFAPVLPRLPEGLETNVLEKGVSLSGGEKQRLALARGLLATDPRGLLFLDEPTSSVDPTNERAIYENIFRAFPRATILSAIHRLHLLPLFDQIYYFADGKVVASGTLAELLNYKPFATVWQRAAGQAKLPPSTSV